MSKLLSNIGLLVTNDPSAGEGITGEIADAAVIVEDGVVEWAGRSADAGPADERVDLGGRCVIPGFVDSHSHIIFAGDRTAEFAARMCGEAYTAGGIRTTVTATRAATDQELRWRAAGLVAEMRRHGTTTVEIKSGYGLNVPDEARSLRIASELTDETTYLGAHVPAPEYADSPDAYVELVCGEMLDACAPHAKWIDVFCDKGAFDGDQARTILQAGMKRGLQPRLHANQLVAGPGVQLAVEVGAASADHCTHLTSADVDALANSDTVATLLPGAEFSTRAVYPDARTLIDAGVTVAIATDCNPGSSYTSSMPFCIAIAVRDMKMSPAEAMWASTGGGAKALRRDDIGVLRPGAKADLISLNAPSYVYLAYRPGVQLIGEVL